MKSLPTISFLFFSSFCFGQAQKNSDALYHLAIAYRPAVITIWTDTVMLGSSINNGNIQKMIYTGVPPGQYKIQISGQGQLTVFRDSIVVKKGQDLVLSLTFSGPCLYDHPVGYIPTCPKNHTGSIIPIVYGLLGTSRDTFIKDKKEMSVKYAGCVTTGCDPQFYCKEHGIEF